MKIFLTFFNLIILCSCGFRVQNELDINTQGMTVEKSALVGTQVGMLEIASNMQCETTLIEDFGSFELQDNGILTLKRDRPTLGSYRLPVDISCTDGTRTQTFVDVEIIEIQKVPTPWATQIPDTLYNISGSEQCLDLVVDSLGYSYCAGFATGNFAELTAGLEDALIIKFDPKGNVVWARQMGMASSSALGYNAGGNDVCYSVDIDNQGNVYCGGRTTSSLSEASAGGDDAFVVKLDQNGNFLWASQFGAAKVAAISGSGTGNESCNGIVVDKNSGSIYCAGSTTSSLNEGRGGSQDAFIIKYDSNGDTEWVRHIGTTTIGLWSGSAGATDEGTDVGLDALGNVYLVGNTQCGFAEANGGGSRNDGFIVKFDSAGNYIWVNQIGGPTATAIGGSAAAHDYFRSIAVDASGNSYVAGYTESSLGDTVSGTSDLLAMKFDNAGVLLWTKQIGANTAIAESLNSSGDELAFNVAIDANGNSYYAGLSNGSLNEPNGGGDDGFILKLDNAGEVDWLKQLGVTTLTSMSGDASGNDSCRGVGVDSNGSVFCVGYTDSSLIGSHGGAEDIVLFKTSTTGNFGI